MHLLLSSDALAVIELLHDAVHGDQKHNVDDGIEQAHGGAVTVLGVDQALAVNVGVDDICRVVDGRIIQQHDALITDVEDFAHLEDEHNDDGGSNGMNIVPKDYFGIVERFSVFAATGYNAVLGIELYRMKF